MRVLAIESAPLARVMYLNASRRGGTDSESLAIVRGRVDRLPDGLAALVVASDLQGIAPNWELGGESELLGVEVARVVRSLGDAGQLPSGDDTGVVLAGDLYSVPEANKRGGMGDVRTVWEAFAQRFQWVAGVPGNHDDFGTARQQDRLAQRANIRLLDGDVVTLSSLRVGGVGLIMGNPLKRGRRDEDDFLHRLELVIAEDPDLVVLHEGPPAGRGQRGNPLIADIIRKGAASLTICGHVHWEEALGQVDDTHQVLNVDTRAIVLTA